MRGVSSQEICVWNTQPVFPHDLVKESMLWEERLWEQPLPSESISPDVVSVQIAEHEII